MLPPPQKSELAPLVECPQSRTQSMFIYESIWRVETANCRIFEIGLFECAVSFVMVDCHKGGVIINIR